MVYCGKPSKACAECRVRRTKCDTLIPSCSQCIRAGRICTGYRSESDMMFRDQTKHYAKKRRSENESRVVASKRKGGKLGDSYQIDPRFTSSSSQLMAMTTGTPYTLELSTSMAEQSMCYFFRHYVLDDNSSTGSSTGSFQYLHDIYSNELVGSTLSDCIESLGMVGLASFWKSDDMKLQAHKKYNSGLRLVSSSLRNEEEAKADQTLVAIMLLSLYETNTCSGPQSMESWTKHIIGASSLLQFRGKDCLESSIGRNLFTHLRSQVVTNSMQRHVAVPAFIQEWSDYAQQFQTPNDIHIGKLAYLVIEWCNLRASLSSFHDYSKAATLIPAAVAIDAKLAEWANSNQCEAMIYKTINIRQRSPHIFSDHYHVYNDLWAASTWNGCRAIRILINEIVVVQLRHLRDIKSELFDFERGTLPFSENQIELSTSIIIQLSHDICGGVPYFLGYKDGEEPSLNSARAVSGNLLLWPLYTAACTSMVSDVMCDWVAGRLRVITEVMGIKQAAPLAYLLSIRKELASRELKFWDKERGKGKGDIGFGEWPHEKLVEMS